jgi:DNA mismatch endonuclease, patch repair protein
VADIVDKETRSRMMSGIRGKNTRPELLLRRGLHARGFRFRIHARDLPGKPDIVLPRWRAVVEVHGCFWHRHSGCAYATTPATRPDFWAAKFAQNVERDTRNMAALRSAGWRTATVWECGFRGVGGEELIDAVAAWLRSNREVVELPLPPG